MLLGQRQQFGPGGVADLRLEDQRTLTALDDLALIAEVGEDAADAAQDDHNLMPNLLDCARVHASEGEIVEALQSVFGTYTESPVF